MRLKDTGLTVQDIKDKVNKYMIETYERFDFLAETAEGMYMYDENGTPYLDFYAGIAVNNAGRQDLFLHFLQSGHWSDALFLLVIYILTWYSFDVILIITIKERKVNHAANEKYCF